MDRRLVGTLGTLLLVACTELLAVALVPSFVDRGLQFAGEGGAGGAGGGAGLWGLLPVVLGIALGTLLVLAIVRLGLDQRVVRAVLLGSLSVAVGFVFHALLPVGLGGGVALAAVVAAVVWVYPEWYVVDAVAVVAVGGVTALLGTSLSPSTALVALVGMAIYDAYSVYGSGHMTDLADASAAMGTPTMFVVPTERGTSTRDMTGVDADGGGASTVAMLGAGDALFPGVLVVNATGLGDAVLGSLTLPAIGAFVGSLVGLLALQLLAARRPGIHAGLPPLNAAAILGYLAGAVAAGLSVTTALGL